MRNLKMDNKKEFGFGRRLSFQEHVLNNTPIVPQPVEYEDIDREIIDFFDKNLEMTDIEGNKIPMFTLFSNQRFSEYSQTWEHTDKDGNLLMNFKTLNRENAPQWGKLYSGGYSIPGDNRFTLCMREIIDDTGIECYEVTSMSQPLQIDLKYTLSIITSRYEALNEFNTRVNKLFSSRQCYVRPNGHYMPMLLDSISDNSDYTINERKFFIQSAVITLMAYVIPKDDIKIQIVPKRKYATLHLDKTNKTYVSMDYDDDNNDIELKIDFDLGVRKVNFGIEDNMIIRLDKKTNANRIIMKINDDEVDISGKIRVHEGDDVKISIVQPKATRKSQLIFSGMLV